jgi:hypothetical protein
MLENRSRRPRLLMRPLRLLQANGKARYAKPSKVEERAR